jgi:hypothetical protein
VERRVSTQLKPFSGRSGIDGFDQKRPSPSGEVAGQLRALIAGIGSLSSGIRSLPFIHHFGK